LIKPSKQISLYDIIIIMEGKTEIRQRPVPEIVDVHEFITLNVAYEHVNSTLEQSLKSITIKSLLSKSVE